MSDTEALDLNELTRQLDKAKSAVFLGKNAAFLGSLMCSLNFQWDESVGTAATDGVSLWWAPSYFIKLPANSRKTEVMHELWHVARLHMLRQGSRDNKIWNIACDIKIDLELEAEGYSFEDIKGVLTWPQLDARKYVGWAEEDIYDDLIKTNPPPPPDYKFDLQATTKQQAAQMLNNVVRASHQAKLAGGTGALPGDVEKIINQFLAPIIPWQTLLHQFMKDLLEEEYTWRRPNRRFSDIYLPSRFEDEGKLTHLIYYEDVSGSITDEDCVRFNSEFKYVKDTYQPKKMTLAQFDTKIQQEVIYEENDPFDQVKIVGRGGTSLAPVRTHILEHRPTAAIVFSDLECAPMEPLGYEIPIIWVCIKNHKAQVPFGKIIHIR